MLTHRQASRRLGGAEEMPVKDLLRTELTDEHGEPGWEMGPRSVP